MAITTILSGEKRIQYIRQKGWLQQYSLIFQVCLEEDKQHN